jgi:hypothetical protein
MKPQKFTYSKIVNIHGTQALCEWVCLWGCVGSCKIFSGSVSVRYSVPSHTTQECILELSNFWFCSTSLFRRLSVINCLRRKYSALIKYVPCMSWCHDTCVNVHHWLGRNDFNSSDHFRHRIWWNRLYLYIGIKVVVCLPSKNFGENDVTSRVFLSLVLV